MLVWRGTYTGGKDDWLLEKLYGYNRWLKIAEKVQREADEVGLGRPSLVPRQRADSVRSLLDRFDEAVTVSVLRNVSRGLFADKYYARAVEEAFKCLNNAVKDKAAKFDVDGANLMKTVFSARSPVLRFNSLESQSDKYEQLGYMDIFAGSMTGIRNPRAHENDLIDEPEVALEMLVLANNLMRKLDNSTKSDDVSLRPSP